MPGAELVRVPPRGVDRDAAQRERKHARLDALCAAAHRERDRLRGDPNLVLQSGDADVSPLHVESRPDVGSYVALASCRARCLCTRYLASEIVVTVIV